MTPSATINIDVFSDVICPWCYIGKRRLDDAIGLYNQSRPEDSQIGLNITWRAFLLNPAMPREGMDRGDYINSKFGLGGASFYERIAGVGREVGINFNFAGIKRTPDSRPALRLVLSAGELADSVKQDLFKAYFIDGEDIGDERILARIAGRHDLPYPPSEDASIVFEQCLAEVTRLNIQGVPFFIIENEWALSGAHTPETFMPLFDAALAKKGG